MDKFWATRIGKLELFSFGKYKGLQLICGGQCLTTGGAHYANDLFPFFSINKVSGRYFCACA